MLDLNEILPRNEYVNEASGSQETVTCPTLFSLKSGCDAYVLEHYLSMTEHRASELGCYGFRMEASV